MRCDASLDGLFDLPHRRHGQWQRTHVHVGLVYQRPRLDLADRRRDRAGTIGSGNIVELHAARSIIVVWQARGIASNFTSASVRPQSWRIYVDICQCLELGSLVR